MMRSPRSWQPTLVSPWFHAQDLMPSSGDSRDTGAETLLGPAQRGQGWSGPEREGVGAPGPRKAWGELSCERAVSLLPSTHESRRAALGAVPAVPV